MLRRQRPGGSRHPPPLAPTVSNFKPRAQWNKSGSSIILYVNLPGFYRDQIEIKKDEKTRAIYIQGQRPLSTQTKARFNEVYRVPDSYDMTKLNTSFSHGLLTIEFPAVVEGEKTEKAGNGQGKSTVRWPDSEENGGNGLSGSSLGRKKPLDKEKQLGTSQEKAAPTVSIEEPKTYKSVVEGKRAMPAAKVGEASSSSGTKQEKEAAQTGQQKTVEKVKEEEARSTSTVDGSLKAKVHEKEEKAIKSDTGQKKNVQKVKEEGSTRTPTIGGSLEPKVHSKEEKVERKRDGEIGQKLKEEGKINLELKKHEEYTKPVVGDNARRTEKEADTTNQAKPELETKERGERLTQDVNGNVISKQDKKDEKMVGDKVSEGGIQERVEEAGLVKETRDQKDDPGEPVKEESSKGGEDGEKMVQNSTSESEKGTLLVKEQRRTSMDTPATEGRGHEEEGSQKYDSSLVNVGVASLVIMVFGAYVFVPLVKMFY